MTYEEIVNAAKVEIESVGGSVEIDMSEPAFLIELELYHAFCTYDSPDRGNEICNRLITAGVREGR